MKINYKRWLSSIAVIFIILGIILIPFLNHLNNQIDEALKEGWFLPSIEYYSSPLIISQSLSKETLTQHLNQRHYRNQTQLDSLKKHEFIELTQQECQTILPVASGVCVLWLNSSLSKNLVVFQNNKSTSFYQSNKLKHSDFVSLDPFLFAQHEGHSLKMRKKIKLSDVPFSCLQSITVAEDQNFLIHKGASPTGIARAFFKNIQHFRIKEGGSTITQQLIKNKFLTPKRTFRRKLIELIMALMLETKLTKDDILELYLNTIYMGRSASYNIYGFASASEHYFKKPLSHATLAECALLSIIVQSPGGLNPFRHAEKAKNKRDLILNRLYQNQYISEKELSFALKEELPSSPQKIQTYDVGSYFVQAIYQKIQNQEGLAQKDLKIKSTLDLNKQSKAQDAVTKGLKVLNPRAKRFLKELYPKEDLPELEAALIHVDLKTNQVRALVGGRHFNKSPFNRALRAYRSIGSLVKPFIVLSALQNDSSLNPLSVFKDEPFPEESPEENKWSPKNYKDIYHGEVPLYFALAHSLNSVSVRLGLKVGLNKLVRDFEKLGLKKEVLKVPAITLGAMDLSLWDITQMYSTIARMGSFLPLNMIESMEDSSGSILFQNRKIAQQVFPKKHVATLIGMMKQVMVLGTARWVRKLYPYPVAGKTGTSNEERDSWFVGFTPQSLTAVWVGYDDNRPHGLTGAGGALLIWFYFMQSLKEDGLEDFDWPRPVKVKDILTFQSKAHPPSDPDPSPIQLVFEKKSRWYNWFSN